MEFHCPIITHYLHRSETGNCNVILTIFFLLWERNRCGCTECVTSRQEDSLRHSRSRINAYRALASPSLISLSSKDPILTAFELSWELRRLSFMEHEFRNEYQVTYDSPDLIINWLHIVGLKKKQTNKQKPVAIATLQRIIYWRHHFLLNW